jgi:hypothetical protein
MVETAHTIWNAYGQQDFVNVCNNCSELASNLRLSIGFLGRLHIGFNVMVRAAVRLNKFQERTVCMLSSWSGKKLKRTKGKSNSANWTLGKTFQSLSLPFDEATRDSQEGA